MIGLLVRSLVCAAVLALVWAQIVRERRRAAGGEVESPRAQVVRIRPGGGDRGAR